MRRLLPLLLLIAAGPASPLVVEHPELRVPQGGLKTTAAYFTVRNTGKTTDVLTGAACDCAQTAGLHESRVVNGISRMAPAGPLILAPGGQIAFKPGGLHLMLTGLKRPIRAGEIVHITLAFAKAGRIETAFKATDTAGATAMDGMAGMHH